MKINLKNIQVDVTNATIQDLQFLVGTFSDNGLKLCPTIALGKNDQNNFLRCYSSNSEIFTFLPENLEFTTTTIEILRALFPPTTVETEELITEESTEESYRGFIPLFSSDDSTPVGFINEEEQVYIEQDLFSGDYMLFGAKLQVEADLKPMYSAKDLEDVVDYYYNNIKLKKTYTRKPHIFTPEPVGRTFTRMGCGKGRKM